MPSRRASAPAASRFVLSTGLVVRGNWIHGNHGFAAWGDIANRNMTFDGNTIEDNTHAGIFYEISRDAQRRCAASTRVFTAPVVTEGVAALAESFASNRYRKSDAPWVTFAYVAYPPKLPKAVCNSRNGASA
jgi:hypothetical protein